MKRLPTIIFVMLMAVSAYSQEHFRFRGIEMKGKVSKFARELTKKGYVIDLQHNGDYLLKGNFGGYDSNIYLYDNNNRETQTVIVTVDCHSWMYMKKVYNEFASSLEEKYGEPLSQTVGFKEPYSDGDGKEFEAIRNGYSDYSSLWAFENGLIGRILQCDTQNSSCGNSI